VGGSGRWHGWSRNAATPTPDAAEVQQLLDDVHRLRLTLTADLSAAASAVEAEELQVARDIVTGDALEVRRLGSEVRSRTAPADAASAARPRRALLVLPAIPLVGALAMTGAAAFGGGHDASKTIQHAATSPTSRATPGEIRQTAASTLQQLERVVHRDSHGAQVVTVANHLHDQISAIIARSPHDARSLGEVTHLLQIEQRLLASRSGAAAAEALAASRRLTHLLHITTLPSVLPTTLPTDLPTPRHTPTAKPTHSKTATPKPSSSPSNPLPTSKPTRTSTKHHHAHHVHNKHHLLGSGLIQTTLGAA
jgi:hypothetical protein